VGSFGDQFRQERERRGLTLDDVSNVTKIGSRMLKAIEDEHFDQLPCGVFNKGFIRAYAKHLGLNDEQAVTYYLGALRQAHIEAQTVVAAQPPPPSRFAPKPKVPKPEPVPAPDKKPQATPPAPSVSPANTLSKPPEPAPPVDQPLADRVVHRPSFPAKEPAPAHSAIPWKVPAAALLLILSVAFLWSHRSRNARAEATGTHAQASQPAPAPIAQSVPANPSTVAAATPASLVTGASASDGTLSKPGTGVDAAPPAYAEKEVIVRKFASSTATPATAVPAAKPFVVQIRAAENSWISVTADGQLISQETLIAPASTSARATRELVIRTGNAAGISFVANGKEIPAQGTEGEVKTYVFDSTGLHDREPATSAEPR